MRREPEREPCGALSGYAEARLQLADRLRELLHWAERYDPGATDECRALLARLAEDRFYLAILGQFSRGKSTLMNALLGESKLPTGLLPVTSVITMVSFHETERVLLHGRGASIPVPVPLADLPRYVTQDENPGNRRGIDMVEVQLPNDLLRLGVQFVDTPGIASAERSNTQTTLDFLAQVDAAIVVTGFDAPLTESEWDLLERLRAARRPVFLAVNKQDLVSAAERAQGGPADKPPVSLRGVLRRSNVRGRGASAPKLSYSENRVAGRSACGFSWRKAAFGTKPGWETPTRIFRYGVTALTAITV